MAAPDIIIRGPLFDNIPPGAQEVIEQAVTDTIKTLVADGETDIKLQLYPGHGQITGHYKRSIHGEIINSRLGHVHDSKVVYGPWLEGISRRNAKSRFKGYRMFANTREKMRGRVKTVLDRHIRRLVAKLGG